MQTNSQALSIYDLSQHWQEVFSRRLAIGIADNDLTSVALLPAEDQILASLPDLRKKSWVRGRKALKMVLQSLGLSLDTSQLCWPHPFLSLSHSGKIAIAVASFEPSLGIGIDLECYRHIPKGALDYYLSAAEAQSVASNADALRLWTVKEAIFKADPNNEHTLLSSYEVADPRQASGESRSKCKNENAVWTYDSVCIGADFVSLSILK